MGPPNIRLGKQSGEHGLYTFFKSFAFLGKGKWRVVQLGKFFFVRIGKDGPICVGELQLVWTHKNTTAPLSSVRLYFLPEQLPAGRQPHHGEDETVATEKIVLQVKDLLKWIIYEGVEWSLGREMIATDKNCECKCDPDGLACNVIVVNFNLYCRVRAMLKRLDEVEDIRSMMSQPCFLSLLGLPYIEPKTYILFCRETFDHPDLENHDFRCDHLAPNLKGRPRKKKHHMSRTKLEAESDDDGGDEDYEISSKPKGKGRPKKNMRLKYILANRENFQKVLYKYMKDEGTPINRVPSLGFKKLDLYSFFKQAHKIGGYHEICQKRLWKHLYDQLGGNPNNTSAATCTKRHYEKLLLSFEKHLKTANSGFQSSSGSGTPPPNDSTGQTQTKETTGEALMVADDAGCSRLSMDVKAEKSDSQAPPKQEECGETKLESPSPIATTQQTCPLSSAVTLWSPTVTSSTATATSTVSASCTWPIPKASAAKIRPVVNPHSLSRLAPALKKPPQTDLPPSHMQAPAVACDESRYYTTSVPAPPPSYAMVIGQRGPPNYNTVRAHDVQKSPMPLNVLGPCHPAQLAQVQLSPWQSRLNCIYSDPDLITSDTESRISQLKRKLPDYTSTTGALDLSKRSLTALRPAHCNSGYATSIDSTATGAIDLSKTGNQAIALVKKEGSLQPKPADLMMSSRPPSQLLRNAYPVTIPSSASSHGLLSHITPTHGGAPQITPAIGPAVAPPNSQPHGVPSPQAMFMMPMSHHSMMPNQYGVLPPGAVVSGATFPMQMHVHNITAHSPSSSRSQSSPMASTRTPPINTTQLQTQLRPNASGHLVPMANLVWGHGYRHPPGVQQYNLPSHQPKQQSPRFS